MSCNSDDSIAMGFESHQIQAIESNEIYMESNVRFVA